MKLRGVGPLEPPVGGEAGIVEGNRNLDLGEGGLPHPGLDAGELPETRHRPFGLRPVTRQTAARQHVGHLGRRRPVAGRSRR